MRRAVLLLCAVLMLTGGGRPRAQASQQAEPDSVDRTVLDKYCVTCHNERLKTGGLLLDRLDTTHVGAQVPAFEKVVRKLRTREMPPPGVPRPDDAAYRNLTASLERALDRAAEAHPAPGRVPVHRLNRAEYANAIRDLLALEIDGRSLLVADEPNPNGFDNVASVLSVSPSLFESYLSAAATVSRLAIGGSGVTPVVDVFKVAPGLTQDDRASEQLPFGSRGGSVVRYQFPVDGDYTIKTILKRQLYLYLIGMGEPHQIDLRLDGVLLKRFTVGGEGKGMTTPESFAGNTQGAPDWEVYMHTADANLEVRVPVKAGPHEVSVSVVRQKWESEGVLQPPQRGFARTTNELYFGEPAVESLQIGGPWSIVPAARRTDTPSRRRIFVCRPPGGGSGEPCARRILSTLARRAYRRPVTEAEVRTLLTFYREGSREGRGNFDAGIERGLRRILAAPSFVFRVEREPAGLPSGTPYRLNAIDLASRLSFFLWSSIPDEALLRAAETGALGNPVEIERQVRRMLRDSRSQALVDNFAIQWLKLGKLVGVVPDVDEFPEFDENLRDAMLQETRSFVSSQFREDRSVMELIDADYTFLNERLARHYGIPDVYGSRLRRTALTDGRRGGLLGQASILTVTSYANRTSPVLRGRWLLENVLGTPPPPPPPDVPVLKDKGADGERRPMRDRLEAHRKNPGCAVCHVRMDPLGFSLENFDALGRWRTVGDGLPIDASAALPDGSRFEGVAGLRQLVTSHREDFVRTFTDRMLSYASGRGTDAFDAAAVRKIVRDTAGEDHRWSAIIMAIVVSRPFSMSTTAAAAPVQAAAGSVHNRGDQRE